MISYLLNKFNFLISLIFLEQLLRRKRFSFLFLELLQIFLLNVAICYLWIFLFWCFYSLHFSTFSWHFSPKPSLQTLFDKNSGLYFFQTFLCTGFTSHYKYKSYEYIFDVYHSTRLYQLTNIACCTRMIACAPPGKTIACICNGLSSMEFQLWDDESKKYGWSRIGIMVY